MTHSAALPIALAGLAMIALPLAARASESWSALAVSSEAFGMAKGARSRAEAEQRAMTDCQSRSRKDACEVRAFTLRSCGAVAGWEYRDRDYWQFGHLAAFGDSLQKARGQALADCRKRHRSCRISISLCNG